MRPSVTKQLLGSAVLIVVALTGACNRGHYRQQADQEVTHLVNEKSDDARWALPGFGIAMDPRSRFFDPYPEDCPPMPKDDPASHFMHRMWGIPDWLYYCSIAGVLIISFAMFEGAATLR